MANLPRLLGELATVGGGFKLFIFDPLERFPQFDKHMICFFNGVYPPPCFLGNLVTALSGWLIFKKIWSIVS